MNIPIYRAKRINSDECIIGILLPNLKRFDNKSYIVPEYIRCDNGLYEKWEVDPTTISIHFPDMIASDSDRLLPNGKKDLRIFASLQKDGKGGDIMECELLKDNEDLNGACIYYKGRVSISKDGFMPNFKRLKVTGIKK